MTKKGFLKSRLLKNIYLKLFYKDFLSFLFLNEGTGSAQIYYEIGVKPHLKYQRFYNS